MTHIGDLPIGAKVRWKDGDHTREGVIVESEKPFEIKDWVRIEEEIVSVIPHHKLPWFEVEVIDD